MGGDTRSAWVDAEVSVPSGRRGLSARGSIRLPCVRPDMNWRPRDVAVSALVTFVAGYALWPPGRVYWTAVADAVGGAVTMALVVLLAALVGAGLAALADLGLGSIALGGVLAYAVGMVLVAVVVAPDSPVHLLLYGGLFVCALAGAGATDALARRRRVGRRAALDDG